MSSSVSFSWMMPKMVLKMVLMIMLKMVSMMVPMVMMVATCQGGCWASGVWLRPLQSVPATNGGTMGRGGVPAIMVTVPSKDILHLF